MRIKGFTKRAASDLSKALDKLLEQQGIDPETGRRMTQVERQKQQKGKPGLMEKMKGLFRRPTGPVAPEFGQERLGYLAQKLDAILAQTPRVDHDQVTQEFFAQYPKLSRQYQATILSMLKNYRPEASQDPTSSEEIRWRG